MKKVADVLVVGAGMAGLTAAQRLVDRGCSVLVVDKARGVGGRMATRRVGEATFDHGAQFFTVRSPEFESAVDSWLAEGLARHWTDAFPRSTRGGPADAPAGSRSAHPRYRGVPGMTGIPKHLGADLELKLSTRVASVARTGAGNWPVELTTADGEVLAARSVILTPPVPQTIALLEAGGVSVEGSNHRLDTMTYDQCLVLLAIEPAVELPSPGAVQRPSSRIDWIADNGAKGVSAVPGAVTVHFAPDFSSRYYDAPDDQVADAMRAEVRALLPFAPEQYQVKRWRYSKPRRPLNVGAVALPGAPEIILAGDAFSGARVEGAFLSGAAAAERAAEILG